MAKSLGALEPTEELFNAATGRREGAPRLISRVISDKQAVEACLRYYVLLPVFSERLAN